MNNKIIDLNKCQDEMYMAMVDLDRFCRTHKLRYTLFAGSALGAIRHKNFIPWDDDFDIAMPREDYEKLLLLYEENSKYYIAKPGDKGFYYPFSKLQIKSFPIKERGRRGRSFLWIDIFPVDRVKITDKFLKEYEKLDKKITIYGLDHPSFYLAKNKKYKILRYIKYTFTWIISRFYNFNFLIKKLERLLDKNKGEEYHRIVWSNPKNNVFVKTYSFDFDNIIDVPFRKSVFKILTNWNEMLTIQYGDFMKIPNKDKKITHSFIMK